MKDSAKWMLVHTLHWALLYGAFFADLDGAMYVLKFWVWVTALIVGVLFRDVAIETAAKKPPQPTQLFFSLLQAWCTLGLLIWFGHIVSGAAWLWVLIAFGIAREKVAKKREQLSKESQNV